MVPPETLFRVTPAASVTPPLSVPPLVSENASMNVPALVTATPAATELVPASVQVAPASIVTLAKLMYSEPSPLSVPPPVPLSSSVLDGPPSTVPVNTAPGSTIRRPAALTNATAVPAAPRVLSIVPAF
jgi:hypothetical protein